MKKLNWSTDPKQKQTSLERHETYGFEITVVHVQHLHRCMYSLRDKKESFIGYFKKLSSAKKVAQLIHNA